MITKEDYINRVLLIMNEASLTDVAGNSYLGADTAQVDRHIEGSFIDAWRTCANVMPRAWFKNKGFIDSPIYPDIPQGTGFVVLPDDFYLLTKFKMKGWRKSVYDAFIENDKTSSIQSNEYTRGSEIRPVCTLSNKEIETHGAFSHAMRNVLNYYSLPRGIETHEVEEAIYVPIPKPLKDFELDDDLEIKEQLLEPLAYLSASSVFIIFEKYDIAKSLSQRAVEMFPALKSIRGTNITLKQ